MSSFAPKSSPSMLPSQILPSIVDTFLNWKATHWARQILYLQTLAQLLENKASIESLFSVVGQVIVVIKLDKFLTPEIASKNDARHGINYSAC